MMDEKDRIMGDIMGDVGKLYEDAAGSLGMRVSDAMREFAKQQREKTMPITPPKCRTCGQTEWNHVCNKSARDALRARAETPRKAKPPAAAAKAKAKKRGSK